MLYELVNQQNLFLHEHTWFFSRWSVIYVKHWSLNGPYFLQLTYAHSGSSISSAKGYVLKSEHAFWRWLCYVRQSCKILWTILSLQSLWKLGSFFGVVLFCLAPGNTVIHEVADQRILLLLIGRLLHQMVEKFPKDIYKHYSNHVTIESFSVLT